MAIKRRLFLKFGAIGIAALSGGVLFKRIHRWWLFRPLSQAEIDAVSVIVDLLAPADSLSPGAGDLGVDREVIAAASTERKLRGAIIRGSQWLDERAHAVGTKPFVLLDSQQQQELLVQTETAPYSSNENEFFRRMRDQTFHHYYAHPETWASLCYPGPPQPNGFTNYTENPAACTKS